MTLELENLKAYCERKPGSRPDSPFGEDSLVYKVFGKVFAALYVAEASVRITAF